MLELKTVDIDSLWHRLHDRIQTKENELSIEKTQDK